MGMLAAIVLVAAVPSYSQAEKSSAARTGAPAEDREIVVVLDPGHGGDSLGGQVPGINEKDITLITAYAMKEELEKYDGITVYMTRYDDTALSLAERARIAERLQADFLFSIHYNKSAYNHLYGAEVWIPSLGEGYRKGYACADQILNELCDGYGIYRRGIKTKVNQKGTDYYGIIRESAALGIPAVIIEHCHMDHAEDLPYYNSAEKLMQLGRLNAVGAAKYFGLKSKETGEDYSALQKTDLEAPIFPVMQDVTPPEMSEILSAERDGDKICMVLSGSDAQSPLLYYSYSLDGGSTWSSLQKWQSVEDRYAVAIPLRGNGLDGSAQDKIDLMVRIYNQYDLFTVSKSVSL